MKKFILTVMILMTIIMLGGCGAKPVFKGFYQNEEEYKQLLIDDGKENSIEVDELLSNAIEYIKNSTFDRSDYINTNIVKIQKVEEATLDYVFIEDGKEGLLDTSDFIYVIGETSGHDFANIVCDSETKEVIGYIPIK